MDLLYHERRKDAIVVLVICALSECASFLTFPLFALVPTFNHGIFFPNSYVVVAEGSYRDELISKIVFMCSRDKFAYLTDFAWYVRVHLMSECEK